MMNLNAVDKLFIRGTSIGFSRIKKGSRIVTVCTIEYDGVPCTVEHVGVAICNPEDVENTKEGAWEAFNNDVTGISSSYIRTLLREYVEENLNKLTWWKVSTDKSSGVLW